MATLSIVYPRHPGATFDYGYYRTRHLPLVAATWAGAGLTGGEALLGKVGAGETEPPYFAIGIIHFETQDRLEAALSGPKGRKIMEDISNFTTVEPSIQVNERLVPRR